jgi:hypothetical protein
MRFSGKTILITGASMGIGTWVARELAAQDANLILVARSEAKLQKLCQELQRPGQVFSYIPCDLSQPSQVEILGKKILAGGEHGAAPQLDGIVHNAGLGLYGEFETTSDQDTRHLFEVNFFSILNLTRQLLPLLKNSSQATIMMVSSVISWRAIQRMSAYCSSKAALNLFTEALRAELKKYSIRVVNTYPGRTSTDFSLNAKSTGWRPFPTEAHGLSPKRVAKKMVRAFAKGKRDEYITWSNRGLIWLNFLFPELMDWGLERYFRNR